MLEVEIFQAGNIARVDLMPMLRALRVGLDSRPTVATVASVFNTFHGSDKDPKSNKDKEESAEAPKSNEDNKETGRHTEEKATSANDNTHMPGKTFDFQYRAAASEASDAPEERSPSRVIPEQSAIPTKRRNARAMSI